MPNTNLAPIALFVYNRPSHTLQALKSLQQNSLANQSILYIYADGKKSSATVADNIAIDETRKIIKSQLWCKQVVVIESEENKGLANSVIKGVTEVINKHGKIIVLEDDLLLSQYFLQYMNEALDIYSTIENIYSINAYMFPITINENTTFLLPYTSTWGWGTWKNRWATFNPIINELDIQTITNNPSLKARFNLSDYDYTSMLNSGNNSWGIKWYYSIFLKNGLNVFPTLTLVKNIGFDNTGVNCKDEQFEQTLFKTTNTVTIKAESQLNLNYLSKYLSHFNQPKKNIIKNIIRKILKR